MPEEVYRCAFCEKKLRSGAAVFGLGARLREGLEYPGGVGRMTAVELPLQGKSLRCMVTADGSQAKMDGWDLIFMVCSEECGGELKEMLESEGDLFEEIM